jgi:hypothetical protein
VLLLCNTWLFNGFSHAVQIHFLNGYAERWDGAKLDRMVLVPGGGLEPPHLAAADFESAASTNSAIPAREAQLFMKTPNSARLAGKIDR